MKRYNTPHRRHVVKIRMTEEEYCDFTERLETYGISQAEFIRRAVTKVAIRPVVKTNTKHGKIRIIMGIGWVVESLAVFLLFIWAAGIATGAAGVALFVFLYVLYVIDYTMNSVTAQIIAPVLSNDPKQRPTKSTTDLPLGMVWFIHVFTSSPPL